MPGVRSRSTKRAVLAEAFSESDLPYQVDIVDWQAIGDSFRGLIAPARRPLDGPGVAL